MYSISLKLAFLDISLIAFGEYDRTAVILTKSERHQIPDFLNLFSKKKIKYFFTSSLVLLIRSEFSADTRSSYIKNLKLTTRSIKFLFHCKR